MAIIQLGPSVTGIRGKMGGCVYSANKSGPYARSWYRSSNPKTTEQMTQRGFLAARPEAWRNLSAAQKAAWDTFAALPAQALVNSLGQTYYASGFNWFCKCNTRLDVINRTNITAVPTIARPSGHTCTILQYDTGPPDPRLFVQVSGLTYATYDLVIFLYLVPAGARQVQHSTFYNIIAWKSLGTDPYTANFSSAYAAKYGAAQTGWQLFVRTYEQTSEGIRGPAATTSGIFPI